MKLLPYVLILFVLLAAWMSPALAEPQSGSENRVIEDDWVIDIAGFLAEIKTDAGAGTGEVIGTVIRAEDTLGLDDHQTVLLLNGQYRFNPKHALGVGLWSLNRSGTALIDEQVEFEGVLYDVGADLHTQFDTSWFRVDWRYSLMRTEQGEAGFSLGLSAYQFDIALNGEATVSDGMGGTFLQEVRARQNVLAPVPTVGIFMNYAFRPALVMRVHADFFDLSLSDLEGKLVNTSINLDWYFARHVGLGIGLDITDISYQDTGTDPFIVDFRQSGLTGHLLLVF